MTWWAGPCLASFFCLPRDSSYPYSWDISWYYYDLLKFVRECQLERPKHKLSNPNTIYKLVRVKDLLESIDYLEESGF